MKVYALWYGGSSYTHPDRIVRFGPRGGVRVDVA